MSALRYIIAGAQRSGSSLLCEGLESSGIAGRPAEVFAPDFRAPWLARFGLESDCRFTDYLAAVREHGTGRNGVFGVKIQYMHVQPLAAWAGLRGPVDDILELLFHGARYVEIIRRDRRAQALSWFRAIHTDEWSRTAHTAAATPPALDIAEVRRLEEHLEWQHASWRRYFAARGIEPLVVEYESLSNDYRGEVARVLEFLGLDSSTARMIPDPCLIRQSDDVSLRWRREVDTATGANS
jgi:LPS sulfotransferase NodH